MGVVLLKSIRVRLNNKKLVQVELTSKEEHSSDFGSGPKLKISFLKEILYSLFSYTIFLGYLRRNNLKLITLCSTSLGGIIY